MDLEDRQAGAAAIFFIVLAIVVPLVVLLGSAIAMGWASVLGAHDIHGTIWGWLSDKGTDGQGHTTWTIGNVVWQYYLGLVTAYIVYQLCELFNGCFQAFRDALA